MLDILQFLFKDFWHWLGTFVLLAVLVDGLTDVITQRYNRNKITDKESKENKEKE